MTMRLLLVISTLCFWPLSVMAQDYDLSGQWKGTLHQKEGNPNSEYYFQLDLEQKGERLAGESSIRLSEGVTATMQVVGLYDEEGIRFEEPRMVGHTGTGKPSDWCLKRYSMKLSMIGKRLYMRGECTGNTGDASPCGPGRIVLSKPYEPEEEEKPEAAPQPKSRQIHVKVIDRESKKTLNGKLEIKAAGKAKEEREIRRGQWKGNVPWASKYYLAIQAEGYYAWDTTLTAKPKQESLVILCQLPTVKKGDIFEMQNLYFEQSKAIITPDSKAALEKLENFLKTNPSVSIKVAGHTDNVGSAYANRVLSVKRAKAVADYLLDRGIEPRRLEHKGYGESKPIAPNDSPENRAKNRRVEVEVTEVQ